MKMFFQIMMNVPAGDHVTIIARIRLARSNVRVVKVTSWWAWAHVIRQIVSIDGAGVGSGILNSHRNY